MSSSASWRDFLEHLREITQLIRADPSSRYAERRTGMHMVNVDLTSAITKAAMSLTSGRLQGCLVSQVQEFLERVDQSEIIVDQIPEVLRAHLALRYPKDVDDESKVAHAIKVQRANAQLWQSGVVMQPGTIKTACLPDPVWNPWPKKANQLLKRCDVDLFDWIRLNHSHQYLRELQIYIGQLVQFRNEVVHGDEPQPVGIAEVWLSMRWAARMARNSDEALGNKLTELTGEPGW
jgi:hypothetical protein